MAYPQIADQYCESRFPCLDSIIKGDSVIVFDTLYIPSEDTLWLDAHNDIWDTLIVTKYKLCPPSKVITKVITVTDTIKQTDKKALELCNIDRSSLISQLNKKTVESDSYKKKAKTRGWIMWGLIIFIITVFGLNVYLRSKKIIK